MTFGQAVTAHRKALNLTQTELAPLLDCDGQTVSNWETGHTTPWPKRQVDVLLRLMRLENGRPAVEKPPPEPVQRLIRDKQVYEDVNGVPAPARRTRIIDRI